VNLEHGIGCLALASIIIFDDFAVHACITSGTLAFSFMLPVIL